MKPINYVRKYNLNLGTKFSHEDFIKDLAIDFTSQFDIRKELQKSEITIQEFQRGIDLIRQKWDSINNKTVGELPETLWNYFYATVIVPSREIYIPEVLTRQDEIAAMSYDSLLEYIQAKLGKESHKLSRFFVGHIKIEDERWDFIFDRNDYFLEFAFKIYAKRNNSKHQKMENEFKRKYEKQQEEWFEQYKRKQQEARDFFNSLFRLVSEPVESIKYLSLSTPFTKSQVIESYRKLAITHHPDRNSGSHDKFLELTEHRNRALAFIGEKA